MAELRVVQYDDPRSFLAAVKSYDDNNMNLAPGIIYDRLDPLFSEGQEEPWESRTAGEQTFISVWRADDLM